MHGCLGFDVVPRVANFLLCYLPEDGPSAATVVTNARDRKLFLRDVGTMGTHLGSHALRIAVKDADTNHRMLKILLTIIAPGEHSSASLKGHS